MLLAGSLTMPLHAQTSAPPSESTLKPVIVRDTAEPSGKDTVRARSTSIGKGQQELRDIPQSITVVTEKLIDDRNLDTLKDVLHNTAGITFLAAEGGEEDIRLRGFSLAGTGDIFLDGMRDPAFYERDTFNHDRVELLRGSASMLFGRGSTGGAANQVTKLPRAITEHEVGLTLGSHQYRRATGDFNFHTGENQALRLNLMHTTAQNDGKGNGIDKRGLAASYRLGIGEKNEFIASVYFLDNRNPRMNYGLPWARYAGQTQADNRLLPGLDPKNYYGMASDYNAGTAEILTLGHIHRFSTQTELKTQLRRALYTRDQRASSVRFTTAAAAQNLGAFGSATSFNRGTNLKIQDMQLSQLQSDLSTQFNAWGMKHTLLAGVDYAQEARQVYGSRNAAQGGIDLTKPPTLAGNPNDGASVNEASRVLRKTSEFDAIAAGLYVQDVIQIAPTWKLVTGLRYDSMKGNFSQNNLTNAAPIVATTVNYRQRIEELSKRFGVLWQPSEYTSYHFSYGTSFNTSGDTYSYNATNANTPPEQSRNIEFGAKIDSANKRFTTRYALFYAEKFNERNTDADTAATSLLLSGKRHSAGIEFDITGRLTPQWEIYGSYAWTPVAKIDQAAACPPAPARCLQAAGGARVGDRPGLTPKHSGTIWNTYQLNAQWRIGAGVNFRSKQAPADLGNPANGIFQAPGYSTVDLLAEYRINDTYTIKANLNNVANKLYADSLYRGHYIPGAGRVVQVNMTARF
ncbi:MAG: TonB-dependent siderophore receptor [Brachymonas sp.]|nr:TonB-dependent siderophore receptor [Brachymonas sp.]